MTELWRRNLDVLAETADTRTLEGRMEAVEWEGIKKAMHMLSMIADNGGKPVEPGSPASVALVGLIPMVATLEGGRPMEPDDRPEIERAQEAWRQADEARRKLARDVLERATLRVLAHVGRTAPSELEAEREAHLAPYAKALAADVEILARAVAAARDEGIGAVHQGLHALTTTDHDLLDQAVTPPAQTSISFVAGDLDVGADCDEGCEGWL